MADLYRVATGNVDDTNGWATTSGGIGSVTTPTAADTLIFDANTPVGTITFNVNTVCRARFDNNYAGTISLIASRTISIGDGTPGAGNVALQLSPNATYTYGSAASSIISLVSTSATPQSIISNGQQISRLQLSAVGGNYILDDDLYVQGNIIHNNGGLDDDGNNVTCGLYSGSNSNVRSLTHTSIWTLTSSATGTIWDMTGVTNLTYDGKNGTIVIDSSSSNTRTVRMTNQHLGTLTHTVSGSTGTIAINSNCRIDTINCSGAARTFQVQAGTTLTCINFNVYGTAGNLVTVQSSGTTLAYIELIGDVFQGMDYLSIQYISSVLPYKFYAGANSTNVTGNVDIIFTAPVAGPFIRDAVNYNVTSSSPSISSKLPIPAGSLIHIFFVASGNSGGVTPPSGFTLIDHTIPNGSTSGNLYTYEKIADGTETAIAMSTVNSILCSLGVTILDGFVGTPTRDVTDENFLTSTGTTLSTSAGSGPTNTDQPAIALALFGSASGMSVSGSGTNSFGLIRNHATENIILRVLGKLLTTTAAVETTFNWGQPRVVSAQLVVYKDVSASVSRTKIKIGGTFSIEPAKIKIGGTFVEKPRKVKVSGVFI